MKFPWYKQWENALCVVYLQSTEMSENGEFLPIRTDTLPCNISEKTRNVRSSDGEYVRLSCVIHIQGDIAPGYDTFTGYVVINDRKMLIETIDRPRNPDGSVHHTRLGLI